MKIKLQLKEYLLKSGNRKVTISLLNEMKHGFGVISEFMPQFFAELLQSNKPKTFYIEHEKRKKVTIELLHQTDFTKNIQFTFSSDYKDFSVILHNERRDLDTNSFIEELMWGSEISLYLPL